MCQYLNNFTRELEKLFGIWLKDFVNFQGKLNQAFSKDESDDEEEIEAEPEEDKSHICRFKVDS